MSHYEQAPGLDIKIAKFVVQPIARDVASEIVILGKSYAPVDTSRLQQSIHAEDPELRGTRVEIKVIASAKDPESGTDYSVFQEFGTRYIQPVRYMGRAGRRVAEQHGLKWDGSPPPWPHKGADPG